MSKRPRRVLVCGSRDWTDEAAIRRVLSELAPGSVVIHGAYRGADTIADRVARSLGLTVDPYPADWSRGPSGGPRRNALMLAKGRPEVIYAFHFGGDGTADMLRRGRRAGIPIIEERRKRGEA